MAQLPLRIRTDIRDNWDKPECPLQVSLKKFSEDLGLHVALSPDWREIAESLKPRHPSQETLVPVVASCVVTLLETLTTKIDDEAWADKFMEKVLEICGGQHMAINITTHKKDPTLTWHPQQACLLLCLSSLSSLVPGPPMIARMIDGLAISTPSADLEDETEWDEVSTIGNTGTSRPSQEQAAADPMPSMGMLPSPKVLFATRPPYMLQVSATLSKITVNCSHQWTLEVIMEYFCKSLKLDLSDVRRVPLVIVELKESFLMGPICDTLVIRKRDERQTTEDLNPVLILSFIEGVLGYHMIQNMGATFFYRRDIPFKT